MKLQNKWQRRDSNLRPRAYESPALPLSYAASIEKYIINAARLSMSPDYMDTYGFESSIDICALFQSHFLG